MSRNFELLERAGKQDELLGEINGPSTTDKRPLPTDQGQYADEETAKFVQNVFVVSNSHGPRVVVFSSVEGEGSSAICFRAGRILAAQGIGSVCLVDANLRSPSMYRFVEAGAERAPGLAEAAVKPGPIRDFAIQIGGDDNFQLVPPGLPSSVAQRLIGSDRMRLRMLELRRQFAYVLIDAPPLNVAADSILLGQMADGVILVVEANSTRREKARLAKENIESANVKLLGVVLNNRKFPIPEAIYRHL